MKTIRAHLLMLSLLASSAAMADAVEPGDMAGAETAQGKIAVGWVDTMFNKCDPKTAFEKYIHPTLYKNHPAARDGDELKMEQMVIEQACKNHIKFDFKKVIVQGNLVVIHVFVTSDTKPNGTQLTEIMRIKEGKIVDHWDMSRALEAGQTAF